MKVTIYLPLVFVRKEKHQGLQELFYWVQRKPIQLFTESYSGTTQHYWLHVSLTALGFGWKVFWNLIIQLHCPMMLHNK